MTEQMMTAQEFFDYYTGPMDGEGDLSPMLFYYTDKGAVVAVFADTHPPEKGGMQRTLGEALISLRDKFGPADWVWFGSEAYTKVAPEDGMEKPKPGQLQAQYGTDPDIRETVMVCGACRDGLDMAQRLFLRRDGEVVWLSDLKVINQDGDGGVGTSGGIPALLVAAVR